MAQKEVIIIGAGPGGYTAAIRAAQLGAAVTLIEKEHPGGTCLNKGCIPTKSLIACAEVYQSVKKSTQYGVSTGNVDLNWAKVQERKQRIVDQLRTGLKSVFKSYGIKLVPGTARFISDHKLEVVNGTEKNVVSGTEFIIATGSKPGTIPGVKPDGKRILTSDDILSLDYIPQSILIVGGGVIGLEFACLFRHLGSEVTVVELLPQILPMVDNELSTMFTQMLNKEGVVVKTNTKVTEVQVKPDSVNVTISSPQGIDKIVTELVLVSTGRVPNTDRLGLDQIGVRTEKGRIIVNEKMETSVPGIYAVGDVTGKILLAYVAAQEGIVAAENICGKPARVDYQVIPNCIYTVPELGCVGLTEQQAKDKIGEIIVGKFPFAANGRALIYGDTRGMVKTIANKKTGELVGVHIIGSQATELISTATIALKLESLPADFQRIMFGHPTLSETILESVHDMYREAIDLPKR